MEPDGYVPIRLVRIVVATPARMTVIPTDHVIVIPPARCGDDAA